ncbi:hypothetical protein MMC20_003603 [Loxospora ochrophaea]|nr:hypothetical protein [Loxospora ochrophaea]
MRPSRDPPTLLSLLAVVLSSTHLAHAKPYPNSHPYSEFQNSTLELRQCSNPCGAESQYCCSADQACYTNSWGIAGCGSGGESTQVSATAQANNGQWQYFTTTYVATDLVTVVSTGSVFVGVATPTAEVTSCVSTPLAPIATPTGCAIPCGPICCASGQYCQTQGQCAASSASDVSSFYFSSITASGASASAFIRPTSNVVQTVTSTSSATTTEPFQTPVGTDGSAITGMQVTTTNNGLSGGAIAGIVIGVIAGLLLLFLICAFCCFKGLIDAILGFFGLRNRRRRVTEETIIEERHSRHGGAGAGTGRTWYGGRPARVERTQTKRTGSGWGGLGAVGAGLAGLAVILGLKRRSDRRRAEKSEYGTASSYSYSDYTSETNLRIDGHETREGPDDSDESLGISAKVF